MADVAAASDRLDDDDAVVEHLIEQDDLADVCGERRVAANVELNARGRLHYLDRTGD